MGIVSLPNLGPDPFTVNASVLNGKVDPLATEFNGSIDNDNVKAAAGILASKLNLSSIAQAIAMSSKEFLWAKGADVASATSISLGTDGNVFDITGTTNIQTITAKQAGSVVVLHFDGALTLVDDTGNLELQGSNLTVAAEDEVILKSDGTNWHLVATSQRNAGGVLSTQGDILYRDGSGLQRLAIGTAGYVLTVNSGATAPSWVQRGRLVQVINTITGAYASLGSTAMPLDDTIPQITEGNSLSTLDTSITPTSASNKLLIQAKVNISTASAIQTILGLFQDSTASAIAATISNGENSATREFVITYYMTAGTVSSTTFKLRAGTNAGNAVYLNGSSDSTARQLGGVLISSMTIAEIAA